MSLPSGIATASAGDLQLWYRQPAATWSEAMPLGNTYFIGDVPPPWKRADMPRLETLNLPDVMRDGVPERELPDLAEIARQFASNVSWRRGLEPLGLSYRRYRVPQ